MILPLILNYSLSLSSCLTVDGALGDVMVFIAEALLLLAGLL